MSSRNDDDDGIVGFASPPCFMHEVDPLYMGLAEAADPRQKSDVSRWRKAERERLVNERLAMGSDERRRCAAQIAHHLEQAIGDPAGLIVSVYWPIRGEPDLRAFMARIVEAGGRTALPVVVRRDSPLVFRTWQPGDALERGVWNIPVPAAGQEVTPDVVMAPVVGFDRACYRLGNGGGYFDRTLAAMSRKPRVFGVGYSGAAIATIYPQPHDIAMDVVVTEKGLRPRDSNSMEGSR